MVIKWFAKKGDAEYEITSGNSIGLYSFMGFNGALSQNSFAETMFIVDDNGAISGPQIMCNTYIDANSVMVFPNQTYIQLSNMTNEKTALHLRIEDPEPFFVNSVIVRSYGNYLNRTPPNANIYVAEICNYSTEYSYSQYNDAAWRLINSNKSLTLSNSPGLLGINSSRGNSLEKSTIHDWYLCISVSAYNTSTDTFYLFTEIETDK